MSSKFTEDKVEDMLEEVEAFLTQRLGLDWTFQWEVDVETLFININIPMYEGEDNA